MQLCGSDHTHLVDYTPQPCWLGVASSKHHASIFISNQSVSFTMMAAALAAAEAAMQEAAAQEQRPKFEATDEAVMENLLQGHDPFQAALFAQEGSAAQQLLNEMMGNYTMSDSATSNTDMQSLLNMIAQQEQEQYMEMQMEEQQLPSRPTTHYLTIAHDGKYAS